MEWILGSKITTDVFDRVQAKLGVKFPASYKALVLENDGSVATEGRTSFPDPFTNGRVEEVGLGQLVSFIPRDDDVDILWLHDKFKDVEPGLVTFATDGGGWKIAFDFRDAKSDPKVCLIINEVENPIPLADSFDEYMEKALANAAASISP